MQYAELVAIQTWSQSRNELNTHTEHLPVVQKHNNFLSKEKRKQERKANRIITLDGRKIARRLNDNMALVSETSHKQNQNGNSKAALNEKPIHSPQ